MNATPSQRIPVDAPSWMVGTCIAVAYGISGKLGLLLAIPPGYATAIWPASGIALAGLLIFGRRYWPAVWIGSFATNVLVALESASGWSVAPQQLVSATAIGAGAAAQAYVGLILIRWAIRGPINLIAAKEVFRFLACGGPIACVVNATWAVSVLAVSGAIPASGVAYSWWTWWVGDTIGVLIFAPLALMWSDRSIGWQSRRWIVTASLGITFVAAVLVFVYASRSEWNALHRNFDKSTEEITTALKRRLELQAKNLESIASFFAASNTVDRDEFQRFTRYMVSKDGDTLGVGWIPRVSGAQRTAVETALPPTAKHPYLYELQKPWPRAAEREEHFPVLFFTPRTNVDISGFDLSSEPTRLAALALARDRGIFTATPMVAMTLAPGEPYDGFLLIQPVYTTATPATELERRSSLRGYAIAFFRLSEFLGHGDVTAIAGDKARFSIQDVTNPAKPIVLFSYTPQIGAAASLDISSRVDLSVGGRSWQMSLTPTLGYVTGNTTMVVWLVLAGGLLFSALVGVGALILTGRTIEIEALVGQRTDELGVINEKLSVEICDHIKTESSLREEHNFLELILNNLSEGVIAFDSKGAATLMNAGARRTLTRIWGRIDEPLDWEQAVPLFGHGAAAELLSGSSPLAQALRGDTVVDLEVVTSVPHRRSVTLMITARPILNASGDRTGALLLFRDITESRASERLKHEFISVVSHELRTPLTSIRGSIGLVASGTLGALPPAVQNLTDIAVRNCDRLSILINDLLDIEKIESGHLSLDLRTFSLRSLIMQGIEANAGYAREHEVNLAVAPAIEEDNDTFVQVDSLRFLQVLANLLSNAAKFSPRGATVAVDMQIRGDQARILVQDSGSGIPAEFQPRVFEKFSQADGSDARAKHGTGLGLAISKALIERMSGRIDYITQPGRGTTFFFDLPLVQSHGGAAVAQAGAA